MERTETKVENRTGYAKNQVNQPVSQFQTVGNKNDQIVLDNLPRNHDKNHEKYAVNTSVQKWCTGYGSYGLTNACVHRVQRPVTNGRVYNEFQVDKNE